MISMSYLFQEQYRTISSILPSSPPNEVTSSNIIGLSHEQKMTIINFFRLFHSIILTEEKLSTHDALGFLSPASLDKWIIRNKSFLLDCLVSLSTGSKLESIPLHHPYWFSMVRSSFVASQLMLAATTRRIGTFQNVLGNMLDVHAVPRAVRDFLTSYRLSGHREVVRLNQMDKVNAMITKGWCMAEKKWCLLISQYDNIGFRIRGGECGYEQYTALQIVTVPVDQLVDIGFYNPDPLVRLCREKKIWSEERKKITPSDLLLTEHDRDTFSRRVLTHIESTMSIAEFLPSYEDAKVIIV